MKKIFENPVLNINTFSQDDVITVSGTATQQAEAAIKSELSKVDSNATLSGTVTIAF